MSVMDLYSTVVLSDGFGITALKECGHMCNDFVEPNSMNFIDVSCSEFLLLAECLATLGVSGKLCCNRS